MNLSEIEKCLILNALRIEEFKDWMEDPKIPRKTKRIYKKLIKKFKNNLNKGIKKGNEFI